jgi:tetratricopeptide (TPR) repeat protein
MRKVLLALSVCIGVAACASAPKKTVDPDIAALADADAGVLAGCYDCLLEAKATYQRVAAGPKRPQVITRLFETTLLLTLRLKELALDSVSTFAEAQQIAKELSADVEANRYLALVEAMPPDEAGVPRSELGAFRRAHMQFVPRIDAELAWLKTGLLKPEVRDYLALAIDCGYAIRPGRPRNTVVAEPPPGAPPLIVYRTSICTLTQPALYRLREDYPRFVEASYFLARFDVAIAQQNGPGRAKERLGEAYARFPLSPSVTFTAARLNQLIGDCREALRYYDETLAIAAVHENALLGRTICLSHLKHSDEAIQTATRMIELRTDNFALGYYWRAWNRHRRQELTFARADIEAAKRVAASGEIHTLAGIIEHDQDDLTPAQKDLESAKDMDGSQNCIARWYLGLVHMKRQKWLDAGAEFEDSMKCYRTRAADDVVGLKAMQARLDLEPEFKARQIAGFEAAIKEDTAQEYAAAFNAANYYATGGNIPAAKTLVEIAAKDPDLAEKVGKLRDFLKDKQ